MKKYVKKLMAAVLAGVMVLSLVACASQKAPRRGNDQAGNCRTGNDFSGKRFPGNDRTGRNEACQHDGGDDRFDPAG